MSKIFLDTNYFIDILQREVAKSAQLDGEEVFTSPLSYHILSYINKISMPSQPLMNSLGTINTVSFDQTILENSLNGPTFDLEDNIQLHSAAICNCDYFLTNDKNLLNMKFFGKTKILNKLNK